MAVPRSKAFVVWSADLGALVVYTGERAQRRAERYANTMAGVRADPCLHIDDGISDDLAADDLLSDFDGDFDEETPVTLISFDALDEEITAVETPRKKR